MRVLTNKHEGGFPGIGYSSKTHQEPKNKHSDVSHGIVKQPAGNGRSEKTMLRQLLGAQDYYGLLGLPPYTADKKEIKATKSGVW